ncbi:MAG: histidine kinase [Cytophagales bacterium]|nr:histidine kinase [Cytophagales bacterium]MDW8383299.1 7TM diverse intracellular signaling domain-containing protein [Flammeovirgaceae bacterium]
MFQKLQFYLSLFRNILRTFVWFYSACVSAKELLIDKNFSSEFLNSCIYYWKDTSLKRIDEIILISSAFSPLKNAQVNFGYSKYYHYFTFAIHNTTSETQYLVLDIQQHFIEQLKLYQQTDSLVSFVVEYSIFTEFHKRDKQFLEVSSCAVPLKIEPYQKKRYWITASNRIASLRLPIYLKSYEVFLKDRTAKDFVWGGLIGFLLVIFIGGVLTYISTFNKITLFFCLYILSLLFFVLSAAGYGFTMIWSHYPQFEFHSRAIALILIHVFMTLFFCHFFEIKKHYALAYTFLQGLIFLYFLLLSTVFFNFLDSYKQSLVIFSNVLHVIVNFIIIFVAILLWRKKNLNAKFYLVSIFPLLIVAILVLLRNFKVVADVPLLYFLQPYAIAFHTIMVAYGVSYRFKQIQDEKSKLLLAIHQQQKKTVDAILEAQEKERVRIGTELHDGLGHLLAIIKLRLSEISSFDTFLSQFQIINSLFDKVIQEVRLISHNLAPSILLQVGLRAAIIEFISEIQKNYSSPTIYYYVSLQEESISRELKVGIFRILQEVVTNALKHAHAQYISIQLTNENNSIFLLIEDDGIGFNFHQVADSAHGLWYIKQRAESLGAKVFEIDTKPKKGTVIFVEF